MDDNIPFIRMCYRGSDVLIVAEHNQVELWHQVHTYTDHQTWLQQVYRTLIENNQFTACLHIIGADTPSSIWQSACEAMIAASISNRSRIRSHVLQVTKVDEPSTSGAENWVRRTALAYAHRGQRINGIEHPTIHNYVNYLLHHDSQLISGGFWDCRGVMVRNGCIQSEQLLANYVVTHVSPQQTIHMS
ncbi:MAG: hypothetical protein RI985_1816 [Chloroflexota bacterium]|jgi:hypothetical protein